MPSWHQQSNTHIVDVDYELDNGMKLFNQTQYSLSNVHRVIGVANGGDADIRQKNFSNESRITFGEQQDTLSGMAGLYLARTDSDEILYYGGISDFDDTKRNLGVFGEVSYRLNDRWTLTTALRLQQDQIQRSGTSPFAANGLDYDKTFTAPAQGVFGLRPDPAVDRRRHGQPRLQPGWCVAQPKQQALRGVRR
jgi:outer membrane receptor protein involved in Fe transport